MTPLEQQIADLLGRLATLSEAPAGNLEAQISRSAPESSEPSGVIAVRTNDAVRDRSLYEWYRDQFAASIDNPERLLSLRLAGEREYLRRVDPRVHARTVEKGSIVAYSEDGAIVESVAAAEVIREFEGVSALDVAIIEGKTEAWVIKIRRQHDRNPEDGRPKSEFYGWDEDTRAVKVALAEEEGLSKAAAGRRLGVDEKTIARYWPQPATVAA